MTYTSRRLSIRLLQTADFRGVSQPMAPYLSFTDVVGVPWVVGTWRKGTSGRMVCDGRRRHVNYSWTGRRGVAVQSHSDSTSHTVLAATMVMEGHEFSNASKYQDDGTRTVPVPLFIHGTSDESVCGVYAVLDETREIVYISLSRDIAAVSYTHLTLPTILLV